MVDFDAPDNALRSGTELEVSPQRFQSVLSLFFRNFKQVIYVDARDLQNTVHIFDITRYRCLEQVFKGSNLFGRPAQWPVYPSFNRRLRHPPG